ncbi:MAG: hypothetical protein NC321_14895, partial [Clostridium sp.]|nr:hypothetical protein [Clostridium sp.]
GSGSEDSGGNSGGNESGSSNGGNASSNVSNESSDNISSSVSNESGGNVSSDSVNSDSANSGTSSKDTEPRTREDSHLQIYATVAMIAALAYLLLYIMEQDRGMTEEEKQKIISTLISRAKRESRLKRYLILALIFLVLLYYHTIGKRASAAWREREV